MALTNYDYTSQLNQMKEAQKNAAIADLQKAKNQAYSDLEAEQAKNTANYNTQRNTANIQNRLSAKNFQEYLANTGRANSGLSAQARLQNSNNLNTSLNSIRGAENATNADIYRRRTDADNAYSSGLASANANIESNYIQNLLNERQKQFEREQAIANQEMQERQFQESIRQFNENLALQRQQMQSSFSRGSGGGSSYRKNNSSNGNSVVFDDTPVVNNNGSNSKIDKSLTKELNKKAKSNKGWSYYDTGVSTIRGFKVNGTFYYKKGNKWVSL